jgi:hypothetical protein
MLAGNNPLCSRNTPTLRSPTGQVAPNLSATLKVQPALDPPFLQTLLHAQLPTTVSLYAVSDAYACHPDGRGQSAYMLVGIPGKVLPSSPTPTKRARLLPSALEARYVLTFRRCSPCPILPPICSILAP